MEDYKKIYPELLTKEPPKDGNAFRLQESCRVLENLEKEAKHYASVRKKYKRCYNLLSRTSTLSGTLSFCLSGSGVGTAFSGVGLPLAASLGGLGLICGVVSVITGEAGKKISRKVTKHEKTVSVCESKINSLKDRISKALADDRISDEEFENILAEMSKYHELKKDIRVGFKNKVKKTRDSKPDIPKQILLISKQEISSGNQIYFSRREMKGQLCLTTMEKISDRVFTSQKR